MQESNNPSWIAGIKKSLAETTSHENSPRPPDVPKPSNERDKYKKGLKFLPYQSTNPALLQELNNMIENGLENLKIEKNKSEGDENAENFSYQLEKVLIYSSAFQRFIETFTIYRPFLLSVKQEYDAIISRYSSQMQSVDDLQTQLASKEHEFMFKLKDLEQAYINTLNERDSEKKSLEKIISLKEKEINTIQAQVNQYKKTSEKSERDLAEARSSCILLTSSLKRLEEERRLGLIHEQCLEGEVLSLKATIEKLGEDVEK